GTCSQSQRILPSRFCFGTPVWSRIWRHYATGLPRGSRNFYLEFSLLAGAAPTAIGVTTKWRTCFWPVFLRRLFSRFTASYPSTSPQRFCLHGIPPCSHLTSLPAQSSAGFSLC